MKVFKEVTFFFFFKMPSRHVLEILPSAMEVLKNTQVLILQILPDYCQMKIVLLMPYFLLP